MAHRAWSRGQRAEVIGHGAKHLNGGRCLIFRLFVTLLCHRLTLSNHPNTPIARRGSATRLFTALTVYISTWLVFNGGRCLVISLFEILLLNLHVRQIMGDVGRFVRLFALLPQEGILCA